MKTQRILRIAIKVILYVITSIIPTSDIIIEDDDKTIKMIMAYAEESPSLDCNQIYRELSQDTINLFDCKIEWAQSEKNLNMTLSRIHTKEEIKLNKTNSSSENAILNSRWCRLLLDWEWLDRFLQYVKTFTE